MKNLQIPYYLKLVRLYTRYFPIDKGKGKVLNLFLDKYKNLPETNNLIVKSRDGRNFQANLSDGMYKSLLFMGWYEKNETEMFKKIIRKGDIVFDIGANFGWYTTLFSNLVHYEGKVYAFEPVPRIFQELRSNIKINNLPDNIIINDFALGDKNGKTEIHLFHGLPSGHSSLSTLYRDDYETFSCKIKKLDNYVVSKKISKIDLIKIDVEGAELLIFEGAEKFLESSKDMKIFFEINFKTSKAFGYKPKELFIKLNKLGFKNYYNIIREGNLKKIIDINGLKHGDNILAVKG